MSNFGGGGGGVKDELMSLWLEKHAGADPGVVGPETYTTRRSYLRKHTHKHELKTRSEPWKGLEQGKGPVASLMGLLYTPLYTRTILYNFRGPPSLLRVSHPCSNTDTLAWGFPAWAKGPPLRRSQQESLASPPCAAQGIGRTVPVSHGFALPQGSPRLPNALGKAGRRWARASV